MGNDKLNILKTFTRRLFNCRFRVAPTALIQALKNGEFGYTVEEGTEQVVNNDFVLANDFETLLDSFRTIFREPRLFLKKENVVIHSELASKYNTETLKSTYKDEKLWRIKDGEASPEYVHSYVYEDDFAVYENRFVCFLIDEVLEEVSKKINELALSVETINRKMGKDGSELFTTSNYVDFWGEELPVLITNESATVKTLRSLIKTKKWLYSLKSKPLYKNCKKAGKFNPLGLKPTNILTKDPVYRNCYNFYINYLNKDPSFQTPEGMYLGYVTVNLLGALDRLGFKLFEDTEKIGITNSAVIKFNKIQFYKEPFTVTLTQEENSILMNVKTVDGNDANYLFNVLCSNAVCKNEEYLGLLNYVKDFSAENNAVKVFIVNDIEEILEFNAVYVEPTLSNSVDVFVKAVKSCFLLGIGSSFMHKRYCPVCGSNLVVNNDGDYSCNDCSSLYHLFEYNENDFIWFKNLPKSYNYVSENELRPEVDEVALTALEKGSVVRKTFMQRLSCLDQQIQNYYNQIKHTILSYKKVKSRLSRSYDKFSIGKKVYAKISLRGKTLVIYFALSVEDYINGKYKLRDASKEKKYKETPLMLKVKSNRSLQYALELIGDVFTGVDKNEPTELIDYVEPEIPLEVLQGGYIKKSFVGSLCQSNYDIQTYYSAIKNQLLSYKKVNSRVSFYYDTFNKGRRTLAKLAMKGKTLVLYLSLNPDNYVKTKYHQVSVKDVKKHADTPMMVKVKSDRGLKYAIELVDEVLKDFTKIPDFKQENYREPFKSNAQLLKKGLAKVVKIPSFFKK